MNVRWIVSAALSGGLFLVASTVLFAQEAPAPAEQQVTAPTSPAQAEALRQEAARLQRSQKPYAAIARLEQAAELDPTSADILTDLAQLHLHLRDYPAAIEALVAAHRLEPEDLGVLRSLGVAYMHTGQAEASAHVLQAVADLQPIDASVRFYLGNAYLLMGEEQAAEAAFAEAVARFDQFWPAINNIGLIAYEQGHVDQAMQLWQQAIAIDETAAEPKLALATALYHQGQIEQAEALAAEALWLDPEYRKAEFQKYHLWGEHLIEDAAMLLDRDAVQAVLEFMPRDYGDQ